jgi:hypothetical protein
MPVMYNVWSAQLTDAQVDGISAWFFSGARLCRQGMSPFHAIIIFPPFVLELTFRSPSVDRVSVSRSVGLWFRLTVRYGYFTLTILRVLYLQHHRFIFLCRGFGWLETLTLHLMFRLQVWPVPVSSQGLLSIPPG